MNRRTPPKKKTILVVGGAGYIGSHVNKKLYDSGYHTVVFDNLSRGHRSNACYGTFIQGDIGSSSDLDMLFEQFHFDGIMHFAAWTDIGESTNNPYIYYQNNLCNSLNLFHKAIESRVKFLVFSSSAAIFGMPKQETINETHPCSPINPYGRTKFMVETILKDFDQAYGLKSCCLRYFNAAGADPSGKLKYYERKENNLIPLLLKTIQDPKFQVTLFGTDYPTPDGTCIRDYVHVEDLADAHVKGLEKLFSTQESSAYNLGNAQGFSVKTVIETTRRVTQAPISVLLGNRRPGDPPILVANSSKARRELGWEPRYPDLESMIAHAYKALNT